MNILKLLVVLAVLSAVAPRAAHAQDDSPENAQDDSLACDALSASAAAAVVHLALAPEPSTTAVAVAAGAAIVGQALLSDTCDEAAEAAMEGMEDALELLGYHIQFIRNPYPRGPYCAYGDQSCYPDPESLYPGANPELDLFVQQSWVMITHALQVLDPASSNSVTFSPNSLGHQLNSSVSTVGLVPGFATLPSPNYRHEHFRR